MPHPFPQSPRGQSRARTRLPGYAPALLSIVVIGLGFFSLPSILALDLKVEKVAIAHKPDFPVTVDPESKTITEDPAVNALLDTHPTAVAAAVGTAADAFTWLASAIASLPVYQQIAGTDLVFVTIYPGYREEEVAAAFGSKLDWNAKQRLAFVTNSHKVPPTLTEGQFVPGTYAVSALATPPVVQSLIYDQFTQDIGSRYSTSTAQIVPVSEALTIASLLEREAAGPEDMRLISGIIWNRLFTGMNLQIDATLQYAKAAKSNSWWPRVLPSDKYIKSAYNTYQHPGLPPGPIASPSVAAVLAALNPKKTDCLFYFHDSHGVIHCSADYKQHVVLLKKYYGQGK